MQDIGFRIKKIREIHKMSQDELAVALSVSQSKLSKIENGRIRKIDYRFLRKICDIFQIKIDNLVNEDFCIKSLVKVDLKNITKIMYYPLLYYGLNRLNEVSLLVCV